MTSIDPAPASADVAGLPADPTRYRSKGLGLGFWLILIFGLLCIGGGAAIGLYAGKLFPPKTPGQAASGPTLPWRASNADPVETAAAVPQADAAATPALVPAAAASADVATLSARVASLEGGQQRLARAASGALATAALVQAAQTSRPFAAELAAVDSLLPEAADIAPLRRIAQTGAPTRTALAAEFPAAAARAIAAARQPDKDAGLIDRVRHALGQIITIRRVDYVKGDGPHAVLARAESLLDEGDVEGALAELDGLSPAGREALGGWRTRAERRAEVDRRVAAIREASLRSLKDGLETRI